MYWTQCIENRLKSLVFQYLRAKRATFISRYSNSKLKDFWIFPPLCFCFDLPISPHSTADFYQNSPHFVNKTRMIPHSIARFTRNLVFKTLRAKRATVVFSFLNFPAIFICFDSPISSHSTADFYQISPWFVNKTNFLKLASLAMM